MGDQGSEYRQQNESQAYQQNESLANEQNGSQAGQESQVSHQNYSQADQQSHIADQYDNEAEQHSQFAKHILSQALSQSERDQYSGQSSEEENNGDETHYDEQHDNFNRKNRRLKFTKDGKLESPLVGTIRRGSIGGIGEKGFTESVTPAAIENTPFMGKIGGGKIPLVGEIRRGSISGLGERSFAPSYVGKDEIPLKTMKYGSLGLHDTKNKRKFDFLSKIKKKVAISGSKFSRSESAYYMSWQNMAGVKETKPKWYLGLGRGRSIVGTVNSNTGKVQPGNPLGIGSVGNNEGRPNSGVEGTHFGSTLPLRRGSTVERGQDSRSRSPSGRRRSSLFRYEGF